MATKVQDLVVEISAKTDKLNSAVAKTEKRLTTFGGKVGRIFGGLTKAVGFFGVAFGAAFAARFLGSLVQVSDQMNALKIRVAELTKETGDFTTVFKELQGIAAKTGSSLDATVSVFQRLSFARKDIGATNADMLRLVETVQQLGVIGGASSESLKAGLLQFGQAMSSGIVRAEEFNSILENMPAVAVEIADSLGMSTGELRKMVTAGDITSKQVFDALLGKADEVNAKFEAMPVTLDRATNAMQQSMNNLISSFDEGAGVTETLTGIVQRFGNMLEGSSDIAYKMGDAFKRTTHGILQAFVAMHGGIGVVFSGIDALATGVLSAVAEMVRINLNKMLSAVNAFVKQMNKIPGVNLGDGVGQVGANDGGFGAAKKRHAQAEANLKNSQMEMNKALNEIGKSFVGTVRMPSTSGGGGAIIDQLLGGADVEEKAGKKGKAIAEKLKEGMGREIDNLVEANVSDKILKSFDAVTDELSQSFGEHASGMINQAKGSLDKFNEAWETYAGLIERGHEAELQRIANLEAINLLFEQGAISVEQYAAAYESINEITDEAVEKQKGMGENMSQVSDWMANSFNGFFDTFVQGIQNGQFKFKDFIGSLLIDLGRLIFKLLVVNTLTKALGSMGGGKGGGILSAIGGALTGRATGGHVAANTPYMVGERGAEVFVPHRSGSIVPSHQTGGQAGGVAVTNVFNISTGVQQTVRAELMAMMPQIEQRTTTGVLQARAKGGKMAQAMGAKS